MFASWHVAIRIHTFTNVAGFAAVAAGATRAEQRVRALEATQRSLNLAIAAGMGIVGVAAGNAMLTGIKGAADLQTALVGVQNATGATAKQMDMLRAVAFDISAATAQSVTDSANVMKVMARSSAGLFTPEELAKVAKPAALFADVQFLSRKVPFEKGAEVAIQLAHLFRQYDPSGVEHMFDRMTRLSEMMPHNLDTALRQMTYYMPTFKALHVDDDSSIATMALLDRFGYGLGKGGTNIANLVTESLGPLQLTSHAQKHKHDQLVKMGLIDEHGASMFFNKKTQRFDVIALMHHLSEYAKGKNQNDIVREFLGVFGKQGGRAALLATDPKFVEQLNKIIGFLNRDDLSMVHQQERYMNTLNGQFQLFRTNFASLLTDIMWPWIDGLRDAFGWLATKTHDLQAWLHSHRDVEKMVAPILGVGAISLTGLGAFLAATTALGIALPGLTMGFGALGAAVGTVVGVLTGPVGIIAALAAIGVLALRIPPLNAGMVDLLRRVESLGGGFSDLSHAISGLLAKLHLIPSTAADDPKANIESLDRIRVHGPYRMGPGQGEHLAPTESFRDWLYRKVVTGAPDPPRYLPHHAHREQTRAIFPVQSIAPKSIIIGPSPTTSPRPARQERAVSVHVAAPKMPMVGRPSPVATPQTGGAARGAANGPVTLSFNYHAPQGGNDAQHRRAAMAAHREAAERIAEVFARDARTGIRASGATYSAFGMSPFEVSTGVG